jgi:hypothetical protein
MECPVCGASAQLIEPPTKRLDVSVRGRQVELCYLATGTKAAMIGDNRSVVRGFDLVSRVHGRRRRQRRQPHAQSPPLHRPADGLGEHASERGALDLRLVSRLRPQRDRER